MHKGAREFFVLEVQETRNRENKCHFLSFSLSLAFHDCCIVANAPIDFCVIAVCRMQDRVAANFLTDRGVPNAGQGAGGFFDLMVVALSRSTFVCARMQDGVPANFLTHRGVPNAGRCWRIFDRQNTGVEKRLFTILQST